MTTRFAPVAVLSLICAGFGLAQPGYINTYAGNGTPGYTGDGVSATSTTISQPVGLSLDANGNLYIADMQNARIRRVDAATGVITTVAGGGSGGDGVLATAALLTNPCYVKVDSAGNLYISDSCTTASGGGGGGSGGGCGGGSMNRIRRVDSVTGIITTIAGGNNFGFSGDGGPAASALLSAPAGLAIDGSGNIYIADSGNNRIRRIDAVTAAITTVAGSGAAAFAGDGGLATAASLSCPAGLAFDSAGNLYVGDTGNQRIRRIDASSGVITTVAGTGNAAFNGDGIAAINTNISAVTDLAVNSSGNLIFADLSNDRVRVIDSTTGLIWTIAGNGSAPSPCCGDGDGQQATLAELNVPAGLALSSSGALYISDLQGNRVRNVALPSPFASTALTVSANGTTVPVTFTASLAAINGLQANATGGVLFFDGTSFLGSAAIVNGSGSFTPSSIATGAHNISAEYPGDSAFGASVSPALPVNITNPPTAVTLAANPNPSVSGQAVTLTAAITPQSVTGTVTFLNGSAALGTAGVNSGSAGLPGISLSVGSYTLTAQYSGDASHPATTSPAITLTVNPVSTTTAVTSSQNPSIVGANVTFTATVSPSAATGKVQFLDGATVLGANTLAGGAASFTTSTLAQGTHSITAAYVGDANDSGSTSGAINQVVNAKTATTTTVTSSQNPSIVGATVTLSATVSPSTATGTVQFTDGATVLSTGTLAGGTVSFTTSTLTQGTHSITAVYSGDANNAGSTSGAVNQVVNAKTVTTTTVTSSQNPSIVGVNVTFIAAVSPSAATGTVQFMDGATVLSTNTLAGGSASFATSTLTQGTHSITAVYAGDANNAGSTSGAINQVVNAKTVTTTTVTSSQNPSIVGANVTFIAAVSPSAATGTVQFLDGATVLSTGMLAGGTVSFTISTLAQGTHSITAVYSGDANNAGSTSAAVNQVVNAKTVTTTTVTSSQNPSIIGASVTFTASVSPSAATGTVQFLDGATVLSTGTLAGGTVSFTTSTLAQGTHSITAVYSGDANNAASTSGTISQVVNKVSSTTGITTNPASPTVGQTVNLIASVTPATATGAVNFYTGSTLLGTSNLSNGQATYPITATTAGPTLVNLMAVYQGSSTYSGSSSGSITVTVGKGSTATGISSSVNPSVQGQAVTFTATVSPAAATGTVTFSGIGSSSVVNGVASITSSTLPVGTTVVTAQYNGDSNYNSSASAGLSQTVKTATTTGLNSSPNPSTFGQKVDLTATVTPSSATGSVQFFNGGTLLGTSTLNSGHATLSSSALPAGSLSLTATYSGDGGHGGSTSAVRVQTVNKANSNTKLTASPSSSTVGQTVTFTATVTPTAATGTVQFTNNGTVLATIPVSSGTAVFSTSGLTAGTHPIKAVYSGDTDLSSSQSSVLNYQVH
ncbi:MAG TPA: Ig-like domain repeat protein [Bryobacteraceae bacterium]|nr:Ig-like domain repeat protein [Bryobacteraceae bacterium]